WTHLFGLRPQWFLPFYPVALHARSGASFLWRSCRLRLYGAAALFRTDIYRHSPFGRDLRTVRTCFTCTHNGQHFSLSPGIGSGRNSTGGRRSAAANIPDICLFAPLQAFVKAKGPLRSS